MDSMVRSREITGSRFKFAGILVICLAAAVASWRYGTSHYGGLRGIIVYLAPPFCLLGSAVCIVMLVSPMRLVLDRDGFTVKGGMTLSPRKEHWSDVSEFFVQRFARGVTMIGYKYRRSGTEAGLPGGWTLSTEEMVRMLNQHRAEALTGLR
jgi:hypothetical protein